MDAVRTVSSSRRSPPGRRGSRAVRRAPAATIGSYALAGADTPADVRRLAAAFAALRLAAT